MNAEPATGDTSLEQMHSLLKRQLRRYLGGVDSFPQEWQAFVNAVNNAYLEFDDDRRMLERSLELTSEELLQANSAMRAGFEKLINSSMDGIFAFDREYRYTVWNPALERITGLSKLQVLGKSAFDVFPFLQNDEEGRFYRDALAGETVVAWDRLYTVQETGKQTIVEAHFSPLLDQSGSIIGGLAILRDVTDRKRAEEEVRRSQDRLRVVIDTIPALVWSAQTDGSVDFINQRWGEYTGLSLEEGLGWKWGEAIHPDDVARFMDEWRATLASGEPMRTEARVRAADGEYRWLLIRNVPLRDDLGNIVKWYGSSIDIDDGKRAEEALRKAEAELAHVTRVTTMGEMVASIAHEVNQPLFGIVTNGNACLRWLAGDSPNLDEARDAARRIVRDANRASDVIARIRVLLKKSDTVKAKLDINRIVQETVTLTRSDATRKGVAIRMELAADVPPVSGDRVQLQQVILNLILNGVEAMASVSDRPRELLVGSRQHGPDKVLVTVRDLGAGIDPQSLEKIFDAFYTTKPQGMGMGLAISRSIVERHGGRLWAEPNQGPGATFQFTLLEYP